MPANALANALKDFGARPRPVASVYAAPPSFAMDEAEVSAFDGAATTEVDIDSLVADAVAQAEAALTERLEREHADMLQIERDRHAEELMEFQKNFAEEASIRIQAGIEEMEARIVDLTSAVTARILGSLLTDDMRERSLERLSEIIREALHDDEAVRIRVKGSMPLYEALKMKLPAHADQFDFSESAGFDLSVTIDDSVFETRLAEWSTALSEVLA
ncbi:hypothetical protein [Mesorhizobium sp. CAU 1732]|uniref:hypothetical protein n=1 Tax=Mesorhizobium sp. CAU 1732 TaxID=3140358 RepID=UPI0032607EFD